MWNRILIIQPHNPGDVVMSLFVISRLREKFPKSKIDFIVSQECFVLIENHPYLNKIFVIPSNTIKKNWDSNNISDMILSTEGFISSFQDNQYDLSINLNQDPFTSLIHGFIHSKEKLGMNFSESTHHKVYSRPMEHLYSIPVSRKNNPFHVIDIFLRSLKINSNQCTGAILPPLPPLPLELQPISHNYSVLQIGSAWPGKRWPIGHWSELVKSLLPSRHLVLIGSPEEIEIGNNLFSQIDKKILEKNPWKLINYIGKTTLLESAAIINEGERLITGDTVAMHIAAACETSTIALFGSSNPIETGPYGSGHFVFQYEISIPETLPFHEPSKNLQQIPYEIISDFILKGSLPRGLFIWESKWNDELWNLEWISPEQTIHPFQLSLNTWNNLLNGLDELPPIPAFNLLQKLKTILDLCEESPNKENLLELQKLDNQLSVETRNNLVWEAYRVSINGLSLKKISEYIVKRKERLSLALYEESLIKA